PAAAARRRGRGDPPPCLIPSSPSPCPLPLGGGEGIQKGHSVTPRSRSSFQTLAGVIGMSTWRTPRCQSASTTALAIAAGAPTVADSPTPLAPRGWCGEGVHVLSVSHFGVSTAVGSK